MAYDVLRQRVVLFGGTCTNGALSDTWEWDGDSWVQRSPATSPTARSGHAMAYDVARQCVVLFGGGDDQTWEWDGSGWRQRTPRSSPSALLGHAMAYDVARQRVVLFGGVDAERQRDHTWEWDGGNWTQRSPITSPSARDGHVMACDTVRGRVVLFGGGINGMYGRISLADTWEWDGTNWRGQAPATSPEEGDDAAMAYDISRGRVVLHGSWISLMDYHRTNTETWEWDGTNWTRAHAIANPNQGSMTYDVARQRVVLITAGFTTDDTWEWDGSRWLLMPPATRMGGQLGCALTYDVARRRTVLLGWDGRTWEWDGTNWTWSRPTPSPSERIFYAMAHDVARQRTVLFGGRPMGGGWLNDTWEWDGVSWTLRRPATRPPSREQHALAYDVGRQRTLLFGGGGVNGALSDTWEWDGSDWRQLTPTPSPSARFGHAMAYDVGRQRVVLCGGGDHQTWEWDGTMWQQQSPTINPPSGGMAYDHARQRLVVLARSTTMLYGPLTTATARPIGTGCPGTNGPLLLTSTEPYLGNPALTLDLLSARAWAPLVFALADASDQRTVGGGCTLYLRDPSVWLVAASNAHGFASTKLAVPNVADLRGQSFFAQAFVSDREAAALGVAFSAGRQLVIGD